MTIEEIITRNEDQTFDFKSILITPKALAISIVAFANADGGDIAIGISDKTRDIEGVNQDPQKLNELLRTPLDFCIPSIPVKHTYIPCIDKDGNENKILLIHVPASSSLHTNQADEAFMRVGDKSRKLSFDERVQLMYDKGERYYEDTAVYGATVNDIDMNAVANYVNMLGYSKSPIEYLRENNHFVTTNDKGIELISVACILLFGKNPQNFLPRARTRFIKYRGVDEKVGTEMNVIKDVTFEGTILNQVEKTIEYLETQVSEHTFLAQTGKFITRRDYPKFVIQEMVVNACCHRAYNIKGTEIQIKMFDDRIVFESPGNLPGMVRPSNIRKTHFSRNPKIAAFLKTYHYVKEFGEGVDRMFRELEVNGAAPLSFNTDDFILKVSVPRVIEKVTENDNRVTENSAKVTEKLIENHIRVTENINRVTENSEMVTEKLQNLIDKSNLLGEELTNNKLNIITAIIENPYITKSELVDIIGISYTSISRNIEQMRGKYIRRVGPDKGGFWEIIK